MFFVAICVAKRNGIISHLKWMRVAMEKIQFRNFIKCFVLSVYIFMYTDGFAMFLDRPKQFHFYFNVFHFHHFWMGFTFSRFSFYAFVAVLLAGQMYHVAPVCQLAGGTALIFSSQFPFRPLWWRWEMWGHMLRQPWQRRHLNKHVKGKTADRLTCVAVRDFQCLLNVNKRCLEFRIGFWQRAATISLSQKCRTLSPSPYGA